LSIIRSLCPMRYQLLPVNLVKRPRIHEATVPHFVHSSHSLEVILAIRPHLDTYDSPPPYAILMMSREIEHPISEELIRPSALATQITGSYLGTGDFLQILVRFQGGVEAKVVVGMYHFMRQYILKHRAFIDVIGAKHDSILVVEATKLTSFARPTPDVTLVQVSSQSPNIV